MAAVELPLQLRLVDGPRPGCSCGLSPFRAPPSRSEGRPWMRSPSSHRGGSASPGPQGKIWMVGPEILQLKPLHFQGGPRAARALLAGLGASGSMSPSLLGTVPGSSPNSRPWARAWRSAQADLGGRGGLLTRACGNIPTRTFLPAGSSLSKSSTFHCSGRPGDRVFLPLPPLTPLPGPAPLRVGKSPRSGRQARACSAQDRVEAGAGPVGLQ